MQQYLKPAKRGRDKTNLERVRFFIKKDCNRVAMAFAKAHYFKTRPRKKFPELYEDTTGKGDWGGRLDDDGVIKAAKKILEEQKLKL